MNMPAVATHKTFRRVSFRNTTNETWTGRRWCTAMTGHDAILPNASWKRKHNSNLCVANASANAIEIVATGESAV